MISHWLAPRTVDFNELKMEDSTIMHDLGYGTTRPRGHVISNMTVFNRTLYPADLVNDKLETAIILPSLTRLCCARIAKEARLLEKDACTRLPVNLYPEMLREAIRNELRKIAFTLIPMWPSKVISMIDVVPGVLNYYADLVDKEFKSGCLNFLSKGMLRLVRLFFYVVKKRLTPKLRVLDLRGMALDDSMVEFLLSEIISISRKVLLLDDYDIFIECEILYSSTARKLINFLRKHETKIRLHIIKLNLTIPDKKKIWPLLELIDPTELFGIHLPIIDSDNILSSILTKFSALIALDLEVMPHQNYVLSTTFALLPHLRRLRCCGCGENDSIEAIPKSTLRQLEHLKISRGYPDAMPEISFRHLISARPLRLSEVKLRGWTVITAHLHLWKAFLLSIAPTLKMLDLRECFENDAHFGTILGYILPSVNLVFLNLSNNYLSNETLHEHVPKLNSLSRLKRIVLSKYPKLFHSEDDSDDDDDDEKVVTQRCRVLERKMLIGKQKPVKIEWW